MRKLYSTDFHLHFAAIPFDFTDNQRSPCQSSQAQLNNELGKFHLTVLSQPNRPNGKTIRSSCPMKVFNELSLQTVLEFAIRLTHPPYGNTVANYEPLLDNKHHHVRLPHWLSNLCGLVTRCSFELTTKPTVTF